MDLHLEKLELIKKLAETEDVSVVKAIQKIFNRKKKDFWEELTPEQREEIEEGEREIERGEYVTFESILKKYDYKPRN
ncbi:MAG: hypothetical protein ACK4UK_01170 [Flavobacterium sp.]